MFTQNDDYRSRQQLLQDVRKARKNLYKRELFTAQDKTAMAVGAVALFVIAAGLYFSHLATVSY